MLSRLSLLMFTSWAVLGLCGCSEARNDPPPVVFSEVATLLQERCAECHQGITAAAGYRVDNYLDTIACVPSGETASLPADASAPLIAVLDQPDHAGLLSAKERALLQAWVQEGALARQDGVHPPGIIDPRSSDWHGMLLAAESWQPMLDASLENACGQCHSGTPAASVSVNSAVPGATACTTCHSQPEGVLACGTCHGQGQRAFPPRDPCFFPDGPKGLAHAAHVLPSEFTTEGVDCTSCHPSIPENVISATHGNGMVDVVFPTIVGGFSSGYSPQTGTCDVACHNRGGTEPIVGWEESVQLDCNSCHLSPPLNHFRAACNSCHVGIDAEGTMLSADAPHINGQWDFRP